MYLVLAVACSIGVATVFSFAERRGFDRVSLLAVNYAAATVLAAALQGSGIIRDLTPGIAILGTVQGILFIGGFVLFAVAIRDAGMGLAAGVMRLSVVIPVLASWWIWKEVPSGLQLGGLVLAAGAFVLVARPATSFATAGEAKPQKRHAALTLVLLFVVGGAADLLMKVFAEVHQASAPPAAFLLFVFGVAFLIGTSWAVFTGLRTGRWPRRDIIGWGALLGVINYGSSEFFLRAVAALDGPMVFPFNSVAIVLGAALVGFVVWDERLSRANLVGLGLAMVALVLLSA